MRDVITYDFVKTLIEYNPDTGDFVWKVARRGNNYVGINTRICTKSHGYHVITILNKKYNANRLAWLLHYGVWPDRMVDHINGNTTDDRITNLRLADNSQNCMNKALRSDNKSGMSGVYFNKQCGKWCVQIMAYGKVIHVGVFFDLDEAKQARMDAEHIYHGKFAASTSRRIPEPSV